MAMNLIRHKTKKLLRFHSGYHGDLGRWLMPIVSGNLGTKFELNVI